MSEEADSLSQLTHTRFRAALGEPTISKQKDLAWAIRPSPSASIINVLLNGVIHKPVVWVFDPHGIDGVFSAIIREKHEIDPVIQHIRERITRASAASQKS